MYVPYVRVLPILNDRLGRVAFTLCPLSELQTD